MALIKFCPANDEEREALAEALEKFVETDEQLEWLKNRVQIRYPEWPGIRELRACFCSKFRPKDGLSIISAVQLDGIASEAMDASRLTGGAPLLIETGADPPISDPRSREIVAELSQAMPKMPSGARIGGRFEKQLLECLTAPGDRDPLPSPTPQVITSADVSRAVEELHRSQQAQKEFGQEADDGEKTR
jgi:hypothetical protein